MADQVFSVRQAYGKYVANELDGFSLYNFCHLLLYRGTIIHVQLQSIGTTKHTFKVSLHTHM